MTKFCWRKYICASIFLTVFGILSASASAVSFQIIQHDLAQDKIRAASSVMEGVFFDYFFDSGHIATNIPTAVSFGEKDDDDLFCGALADSRSGLCNYLILVFVEYDGNGSSNPDAVLLSNIQSVRWIVYDVSSESIIGKGDRVVGTVPDKNNNVSGVKSFTKKLAVDISSALKKR